MTAARQITRQAGWRVRTLGVAAGLAVLCLCALGIVGEARATVPATPQPRQLTVADGLPSNTINGFAEDAFGYLWLASGDGLARYDGRGYRIWRIEDGLRDNMIWAVHVDARNRVWVGTENAGLVMLSADRRRFHYYDHHGYPQMLGNTVWCVESTPDGSIWFGTSTGGLYRITPAGKMERYLPLPGDDNSVPAASVNFLKVGPDGTLWVAAKNGVARWNGQRFERLQLPGNKVRFINGLAVEPDGSLWIADSNGSPLLRRPDGSWDPAPWRHVRGESVLSVLLRDSGGGYWLDTLSGLGREKNGELRNVPLYSSSAHGLVKPNWSAAYEDHEGGIWFASPNTGLWHLPANWRQFAVLANRQEDPATIANPYVLAAARSGDGRFWLVGTRGVLDRLDPATGAVEHHLEKIDGLKWPQSVLEDQQGRVWIGLYKALVRYDPATAQVQRWHDTDARDAAMHGEAEMIAQTPDGRLWLYSDVDGMQLRDPDGHVLRRLPHDANGLTRELAVNEMRVGPDGELWLASSRGLLRWNAAADAFVAVPGAPAQAVYATAATDAGIVWLAGMGQLQQYFWDGRKLQLLNAIGVREDFPALEPGGLVVDPAGVAWVSSMRGLIRIDPANRAVRIYGVHDGLPNQQFRPRTLLQSRLGQVVAATPDGLVLFDPAQVRPSTRQPPLMIERVGLRRGESGLDLTHVEPLVIADGDRDLHIVARMLSFSDSDANSYRFKLSGYDPDWIDVGPSGERLFSRLPAGEYTLEVQGKTVDGVWSKVRTVAFRVLPPWWRSHWGMAALAGVGVLLLLMAVLAYRRRLRRLHAWQLAIHKQELAEQASLAKTRFLATLGHEVRTPMTGVMGMSELLLNTQLDTRQRGYTEAIRRAGAHLLRLVNDALDLARIESGKLELDLQPFSVNQLVEEVAAMTAPLAESRGLRFELDNALPGELAANGDVTRVRQILLNLLNNAVKFTERGSVTLRVSALGQGQGLRFEVIDTGPGISAEQQQRLFRRFEQGEGPRTAARYGGSGLGLAICQELAVAMSGRIDIVSKLGAGTRFSVELPLRWVVSGAERNATPAAAPSLDAGLQILLVEDDATIAEVIAGLLTARGHRVVHAAHGLAALTEVAEQAFDVALLDLDLPGLDGFALARQLRVFGHAMPLIAVTARADAEAEPAARAAGFDGFLRKPVTGEILSEAIAQVLRN
ncbi:MAG TPA: ATP-binding protein [Stenotrophomonas sp.]|nr:ATP-binding protein [Stenotrophomonas sp.]